MPRPLEGPRILHCDADWVIVHKPAHLLVHRTDMAFYDRENLRDWLMAELPSFARDGAAAERDGVLQPVNRLDRPTSGLVVFARNREAHRHAHAQFAEHRVEKEYIAVVRGHLPDGAVAEKPLPTGHNDVPKPARTRFETLGRAEWPVAITRYPTSRFSLVRCLPETGRYHQIRLHLRHLRHPIIGDTAHGDKPHNRYLAQEVGAPWMFLHAARLTLEHPRGGRVTYTSPVPALWEAPLKLWGWEVPGGRLP